MTNCSRILPKSLRFFDKTGCKRSAAGFDNATGHKFRHTLAIEIIRHGATFQDVAAALGNTVGVVAKFYSHEWAKV